MLTQPYIKDHKLCTMFTMISGSLDVLVESTYALTPLEHIAYLSGPSNVVSKHSGTMSEGSMRFYIGCDSSHDAYAQTRCHIEE